MHYWLMIHYWLVDTLLVTRKPNCLFYYINTSYPMDNSLSGRCRPARQTSEKDVLCLHQQVGPEYQCTRQMACRTSFLSRQSDVIASFSFGANQCTVENFISARNCVLSVFIVKNDLGFYIIVIFCVPTLLCLLLARREGVVVMQWPFSMDMLFAHVVGKREKVRNLM